MPDVCAHRPDTNAAFVASLTVLSSVFASDNATERKQALDAVKLFLAEARACCADQCRENGQGRAAAKALSTFMDAFLRPLFDLVVCQRLGAFSSHPLVLMATGGYGRGTLAPHSDLDLLFLMGQPSSRGFEEALRPLLGSFLALLWDLGLKVGHATRTVQDCVALAKEDMTIRTALLDARPIMGDEALAASLLSTLETQVHSKTLAAFVSAKLNERDERLRKLGGTRYLVEPHLKDGKGGLRDLQTLLWLTTSVMKAADLEACVAAGLFQADEKRLFEKAEDFLWTVRFQLHQLTGRPEERLSFDVQPSIAKALRYRHDGALRPVERFMKRYFLVARDVGTLARIVFASLERSTLKSPPLLDRFSAHMRGLSGRPRVPAPFVLTHGRLGADTALFAKDPLLMLRYFVVGAEMRAAFAPETLRAIRRQAHKHRHALRSTQGYALFLRILTSNHAPDVVLRHMNETGLLGALLPEFGHVVGMMQFSAYHHYTVDEHLIRTVGTLCALEQGQLCDSAPFLASSLKASPYRRALYVTAFLHDIAKGRPEDHSVLGASMAADLCPRLGLSPTETAMVVWLIHHHLVMSETAQSRDLSDARTLSTFRQVVGDHEHLKWLYALTLADIAAVGPGVLSAWKERLLRTLYDEGLLELGGDDVKPRDERVAEAQAGLKASLPDWTDDDFRAYVARHYPAYWLRVDAETLKVHAQLLAQAKGQSLFQTLVVTDAKRGVTDITVVAPDNPRLLAGITGVCAASQAAILDARIFTTSDGFAVDTFSLARAFSHDEDELRRGRRLASRIEGILQGSLRLRDLTGETSRTNKGSFVLEPKVTLSNALSARYTLIEVEGLDRVGLLHDLTRSLAKLNLNIASARITTYGEKAIDVFYVTDLTGAKITDGGRMATIHETLLGVFSQA